MRTLACLLLALCAGILHAQRSIPNIEGETLSGKKVLLTRDLGSKTALLVIVTGKTQTRNDAERAHILRALNEAGGIVGGNHGAASRLGLPRTSLLYRMKKLGIKLEKSTASANTAFHGDSVEHSTPVVNL